MLSRGSSSGPTPLLLKGWQQARAAADAQLEVREQPSAADLIPIECFEKQQEFVDAEDREVGYGGAYGSGKSVALCIKSVKRASHPRAREGLCRKDNASLEKTTLKVLLDGDGDTPAVLTPGTYRINWKKQLIDLAPSGGGQIQWFGLDSNAEGDALRAGGHNLTGVGVDEAIEITEKNWVQLRGRVRSKAGDLSRQIYWASNPGAPSQYLALRYGIALGTVAAPGTRFISTAAYDNPHLPQDYLDDLSRLVGTARRRYYLGEWVGQEGLVFENFTREANVWTPPNAFGPWARTVLAVDEGHTNPFVILLARIDSDGRAWIQREVYETKLLLEDKMARFDALRLAMAQDHELAQDLETLNAELEERAPRTLDAPSIEAVIVDPSAADLIAELCARDYPAVAANNEVDAGIKRVRQALAVAEDGRARLTLSADCLEAQKEAALYMLKPGTELPIKKHDHAWDAIRYLVSYLAETDGSLVAEFF